MKKRPTRNDGNAAWFSATQSRAVTRSTVNSGGLPARPEQASARLTSSAARSGGALLRPSTSHAAPAASNTLTAPKPSSAAAAASAAAMSGATSDTRQRPPISGFLDEAVDHHLVACLVEGDGELVALGRTHGPVAEFLMKDPVAGSEAARRPRRTRGRCGGERAAAAGECHAHRLESRTREDRAWPPGLAQALGARKKPGLHHGLGMLGRQLREEARRQRRLPLPVDPSRR